jgi:hypothetical protein
VHHTNNIKEKSIKDYIMMALIVLSVVAIGLFVVNQTLEFFYKAEFLKSPCGLCEELNQNYCDTKINKENNIMEGINLSGLIPS